MSSRDGSTDKDVDPYHERDKIGDAILDCYLIEIDFCLHNCTFFLFDAAKLLLQTPKIRE